MRGSTILAVAAALALAAAAAQASGTKAKWSYEGPGGPQHWGDLDAEYALCKAGKAQSPIDLADANVMAGVTIATDYRPLPLTVLHNGHTVQFNVGNGSTLTSGGKSFDLVQVHFHAPTEHAMGGRTFPLEAHFVHQSAAGKLAVIGVMIVEGAANPALAALLRHLPMQEMAAKTYPETVIDPAGLMPAQRDLFRYMGSLTTPPCSEGVNWHVMAATITASAAQIEMLAKAMGANARPVQAANDRLIVAPAR
ncbi:MAG: carbonic anhydrase [Alphaproteobacteria bacterium]